jgi:hypothetical protein
VTWEGLTESVNDSRIPLPALRRNTQRITTIFPGDLLQSMELQFNQLGELGLLRFNQARNGTEIRLDPMEKPEVIFILANHNPTSSKLAGILGSPEVSRYANKSSFDLRFFVSAFSGYGLHGDCMLDLDQFQRLVQELSRRKRDDGTLSSKPERKRMSDAE